MRQAGTAERWNVLLRRMIGIMGEEPELGEVVRQVAALVCETTGSDVCFVHLVDEARGRLVLAGATPPFDELAGTIELVIGEGVAGWVAQHGRPAVVDDKWQDPRYKYIPALKGEDFASLISVPLLRPGRRVVGVINVHSRVRRDFTDDEVAGLTDVAGLLAGIVETAVLYHRLEEREEQLEQFTANTIELQELERRRLAADIHDGISQRLVSLWYHLSAAADATPDTSDLVEVELAAARDLAAAALEDARRAVVGLRPVVLDDLGLGAGLEHLAGTVPGIKTEVEVEECDLSPHVETALFRIAQEALQNVAKHAGATHVSVRLRRRQDGVQLVVADDGRGFDPEKVREDRGRHSYGLAGIRERAALLDAQVRITSKLGEGTTVSVTVPAEP